MNCPLCGAELKPYESLCASCREKQQMAGGSASGAITSSKSDTVINQDILLNSREQASEPDMPSYLRSGYSVSDEPGKPGIFRRYRKQIIISVIILFVLAAGAVTAFFIIESKKPGFMSISAAAQNEMDLMNAHNWTEIINEVSDEDMKMIFEHNKEGLLYNGIHNADELRREILLYASFSTSMNSLKDAKLESDKIENEKGSLIEENIQDDSYYLASKEGLAKHWFSHRRDDGSIATGYLLLYKKDGRWFSLNGLKLSATIAKAMANYNKEDDTE